MTDEDPLHPALLPAGLRDLLPPDAETEAASVEALLEVFAAYGYERVKPPLLEFGTVCWPVPAPRWRSRRSA
jgi:ATP phosphoribosyltransferase regulatory subunit